MAVSFDMEMYRYNNVTPLGSLGGTTGALFYSARDAEKNHILLKMSSGETLPEVDRWLLCVSRVAQRCSANVLRYYEAFSSGGRGTIVAMDFVEGTSVDKIIKERHQLSSEEQLKFIEGCRNVARALVAENLLHPDVKPANAIWTGKALVVIDWSGVLDRHLWCGVHYQKFSKLCAYVNWRYSPELGLMSDVYAFACMAEDMLDVQKNPDPCAIAMFREFAEWAINQAVFPFSPIGRSRRLAFWWLMYLRLRPKWTYKKKAYQKSLRTRAFLEKVLTFPVFGWKDACGDKQWERLVR